MFTIPSKLALVPVTAAGPKQRAGFIAAPEYPEEMSVPLLKIPMPIAIPIKIGANTGPNTCTEFRNKFASCFILRIQDRSEVRVLEDLLITCQYFI